MSFLGRVFRDLKSTFHYRHVVSFSTMWGSKTEIPADPELATQYQEFSSDNDRSFDLRCRIRAVCFGIYENLQKVNLKTFKEPTTLMSELYQNLGQILEECPDEYYRYHNEWSSITRNVVSLLAFNHWLETGSLLRCSEAMEKLGSRSSKLDPDSEDYLIAKSSEFKLDVEDYLYGLCKMSELLPDYVKEQVAASNYACSYAAVAFFNTLEHRMSTLTLPGTDLRNLFDKMKYNYRILRDIISKIETSQPQ